LGKNRPKGVAALNVVFPVVDIRRKSFTNSLLDKHKTEI
jgi:hypothetical protein